jgi:hypothetical protein
MKKIFLVLSVFVIIPATIFAQESFRYKRKITGVTSDSWYTITLPAEIFNHLNRDFSDLRLYSFTGKDTIEVPYLLKIRAHEVKEEIITLPVINKSKKDDKLYLTFELKADQQVNYIDLKFEQPNFFALVALEGSHTQQEWFELTNNQRILSIENAVDNYEVSTISFPSSKYRFLRASIKSDTPLNFLSASFKDQQIKQGVYTSTPAMFTVQHDKKEKKTVVDIKLPNVIPISQLSFDIGLDRDYYRMFTLEYVSDSSKTQKGWMKFYDALHSGYLTSYTPNSFETPYVITNEFKLIVHNQNNLPLTINAIQASAPVVELVTLIKPAETFLFYGNNQAIKPTYDLDYFQAKIPEATNTANLEAEQTILMPIENTSPVLENKLWLWAIMLVIIGVLGFFTLLMMKRK